MIPTKVKVWKQDPAAGLENYEGRNSIIDKMGYVPLERRLMAMLVAGERLHAIRSEMYEYSKELDADAEWEEIPQSRIDQGADITDVHVEAMAAKLRVAARAAELKRRKRVSEKQPESNPEAQQGGSETDDTKASGSA